MSNITSTILTVAIAIGCAQYSVAQGTQAPPQDAAATQKATTPQTTVTEAFKNDIRKLLQQTGADKMAKQMMSQMIMMQRRANPSVPGEFWDEFEKDANTEELMELSIPSYAKHLTHDEIKGLIKFYESPLGKKLIKAQPMIMQESMMAGQKWGMQLGREIAEKLKAGGYDKP